MLRQLFLIREQLAVVFRGTVHRLDGIIQNKRILLHFGGRNIGGIFQGAKFGLKLGIGVQDDLQRLADVILPLHIRIDVVVQFVVEKLKIIEQVVGLPGAILGFGIAAYFFQFDQTG